MRTGMKFAIALFVFMLPQVVYAACLIEDDESRAWNILGKPTRTVLGRSGSTSWQRAPEWGQYGREGPTTGSKVIKQSCKVGA